MYSHLLYPRFTTRIRVLKPDINARRKAPDETSVQVFMREFADRGRKGKAPVRSPQQHDFGIASNMLKTYDRQALREYIEIFWSLYSDPVYLEPDKTSAWLLFAGRIKEISRRV